LHKLDEFFPNMAFNRLTRNLDFTSYVMFVLLVGQLVCFVWALNRGFDFTDEAYSYLGFANPEEITKVATYYAVFVNKVFGWLGLDVIKIRIVRLILLIVCGFVFALGLSKWLRKNSTLTETQHVNLVLFIGIGSLLINANGSQSLTYNLSTTFLLQTIVGCIFYLDQREKKISSVDELLFAFVGGMLFVLFAVKFSVAIFLGVTISALLLLRRMGAKVLLAHSASMLVGAVFAGLFFFGSELPGWLADYKDTLTFAGGQSIRAIASRYIEDVQFTLSSKIVANVVAIITIISLSVYSRQVQNNRAKVMIAIVIALALIQVTTYRVYYLGGPKHYYLFTGLYILLIFALLCSELIAEWIRRIRKDMVSTPPYKIILLFLAIPLFGAIGTGNLISIQIIWYTSFLLAAIYLMLLNQSRYLLMAVVIVISLNASVQAISGLIYYPYRINHALYKETVSIQELGRGESILVDQSTRESIEKAITLVQSKTNFSKGNAVFAFSPDYYGFIYLMGGVLPGWGWYDEKGTPFNCYTLSHSRIGSFNEMIILSPSYYEMDSVYSQCFAKLNIDLKGDYENIGTIPYFMGEVDRTLDVYAPKSILK
jgi:hypothetical protein